LIFIVDISALLPQLMQNSLKIARYRKCVDSGTR